MIEQLYQYLSECPAGAGAEDLLGVIFGRPGGDPAFGRDFLGALLADDPRFLCAPDGLRWSLADKHLLDEPLSEAPFVVVDLETTGQSPEEAGITEIGAVRMSGEREVDRFETLVCPGKPIPPYVASLTGISDSMVADAPAIEEVLPRFIRFAEGAVLVAHNAAFDAALLDRASRRILGKPLGMPSLCTFKLARRLLPDVTKASLDGLATYFGLAAKSSRHRALADAELTAAVLVRLVRLLESESPRTVNDLIEAQEDPSAPRQLSIRIPRDRLEALPHRGGVFWLIDGDAQTLFVGQATDVRARVISYFAGRAHLSDRQFEMVSATADVGFRAADNPLERAVIEAEEICRRTPMLNRADKHLPRGNFVKLQRRGRFPRVLVASRISNDGALYLGPIKSRAFADDAAALVAKSFALRTCSMSLHPSPTVEPCWLGPAGWCSSPCNATVASAEYRSQIDHAENVLSGDPLQLRIGAASQPGNEEVRSRDGAVIGRLLKLHRKRHWLINTHAYVAAFPATGGGIWVAIVLDGFCRRPAHVRTRHELAAALTSDAGAGATPRMGQFEADASTIFSHWIRRPAEEYGLEVIDLDAEDDLEGSLAAAAEKLALRVPW